MSEWITSDLHLGHEKISTYCPKRLVFGPTVHDMNRGITKAWNDRVKAGDTVYVIGDFAFGAPAQIRGFIERLNGEIVLVRGNHDKGHLRMKEFGIKYVYNNLNMNIEARGRGHRVFLRHFPPSGPGWEEKHWAETFLCGHVHQSWSRRGNVINVGVDVCPDFAPMTFEQLLARPVAAEALRPDQCSVCGMSLPKTVAAAGGEIQYFSCPKHPPEVL